MSRLLAIVCLALATAGVAVHAFTLPEQVSAAIFFRDSMVNRSLNWHSALTPTWHCPTDPDASDGECDVCSSKSWSGNWEYLHCRGRTGPYGEGSFGERDGAITTMHITDVNLDGPVPRQACQLIYLREFDLDGGQQTGPFPRWLLEPFDGADNSSSDASANATGVPLCLNHLQELDLSSNRLTGTIPPEIRLKTTLQEFKVEHNFMTGTIPPEITTLPHLFRLRVTNNRMTGTLPAGLANMTASLNEVWLDNNDFSGDLSALAPLRLMYAQVHNNPRLCGQVPASVQYAHGYNPAGTRLGLPC